MGPALVAQVHLIRGEVSRGNRVILSMRHVCCTSGFTVLEWRSVGVEAGNDPSLLSLMSCGYL